MYVDINLNCRRARLIMTMASDGLLLWLKRTPKYKHRTWVRFNSQGWSAGYNMNIRKFIPEKNYFLEYMYRSLTTVRVACVAYLSWGTGRTSFTSMLRNCSHFTESTTSRAESLHRVMWYAYLIKERLVVLFAAIWPCSRSTKIRTKLFSWRQTLFNWSIRY